ncbi:MAG TPA: hypothetical protein VJ417_02300, partial [Candidatus Glassbacteria bacterium]|nr:hypothetical protein [Candidatus Glassbacteria bacterium]
CLAVLPHGLIGIMFAAIFAASMSSIDSTLNFVSGIFSNDIYRKTIRKNASEEHMLAVSRISTLVLGLVAIAVALAMSARGGAFEFMVLMDRIFVTPIVVPLLLGLFFPRRGSRAAIVSFLTACAFNTIAITFFDLPYSEFMLISFTIAYVAFFSGALLLPDSPQKAEQIRGFFALLETPVEPKTELTESAVDKLSMLGFIGKMASATGLAVCLMVLISQPWVERLKIVIGGAVVLALGVTMLWINHRKSISLQREAPLAQPGVNAPEAESSGSLSSVTEN